MLKITSIFYAQGCRSCNPSLPCIYLPSWQADLALHMRLAGFAFVMPHMH